MGLGKACSCQKVQNERYVLEESHQVSEFFP
jgi:hypothetical protein